MSDDRACTCHPSEAPVPCQKLYAFSECEISALRAERDALRELLLEAREWIVEGKVDFNDALADRIDAALKGLP